MVSRSLIDEITILSFGISSISFSTPLSMFLILIEISSLIAPLFSLNNLAVFKTASFSKPCDNSTSPFTVLAFSSWKSPLTITAPSMLTLFMTSVDIGLAIKMSPSFNFSF